MSYSRRVWNCPCGAQLPSPLPERCPRCQSRIVGRRETGRWVGPLVIGLLLAAVFAVLYWLVNRG